MLVNGKLDKENRVVLCPDFRKISGTRELWGGTEGVDLVFANEGSGELKLLLSPMTVQRIIDLLLDIEDSTTYDGGRTAR